MTHLRAPLYFLLGFLLSTYVVLASADTIPKQTLYGFTGQPNTYTNASAAAAAAYGLIDPGTGYTKESGPYVSGTNCAGTNFVVGSIVSYYGKNFYGLSCRNSGFTITSGLGCPEGYTPDANGTTCTKPDADKCAPTKDKYTSGWVSYTGSKVPTGNVCIDGCNYQQNAMIDQDDRIGTDGRIWAQVGQTGLGTSCTDGQTGQTPDQKNKDSKPTPCGATDGVMTTSSGKVLCVPEGTPDARKPDVKVKTKTETYPDNSSKQTTETTTRDPQTGATSTNTTTSSTPKPDGTEGQAGPVGTTTGVATSGSGNGNGDGEGCDPTKQACGKKPGTFGENGDLYEAKYPDGLSGLLDEKYAAMKATPIFGLVNQLAPTGLSNSGTCPTWSFSGFSNSRISIGQMDFNMPCWVWDAVRAIMLVTTLLLARRLVFGG